MIAVEHLTRTYGPLKAVDTLEAAVLAEVAAAEAEPAAAVALFPALVA